ncbi:MAG: response regulator [Desulfobulbus sp.]|jgi:DNA-binding response OmpR family regulator/signal transduction histidine kinase
MPDVPPHPQTVSLSENELLEDGEFIVVVDDLVEMASLVRDYLQMQGYAVRTAGSADDLWKLIGQGRAALVLLDIGLPDADGRDLLPRLKAHDKDMAIIMVTAVNDLQTALDCLRHGADDYLAKPLDFTSLQGLIRRVLEKRRLAILNRRYLAEIEQANFRIQLAHELAIKMNSVYLSLTELDEILYAILVGITANEGLQFNRAFLALFTRDGDQLRGRLAIGPDSREEGARIWKEVRNHALGLHDFFARAQNRDSGANREVNRIVQSLHVDAMDSTHPLIRAVRERRSVHVVDGWYGGNGSGEELQQAPPALLELLDQDTFVVVPLFSPSRSLGVIIADHFVDAKPIAAERIRALETFAGHASLAIEHCHLYMSMQSKLQELEEVSRELRKNKDLLVESERYAALGHMAAQLADSIRNPITTIGGMARLLERKVEEKWTPYLGLIVGEAEKIEKGLESLFDFVQQVRPEREEVGLVSLLRRALLLYSDVLGQQRIEQELLAPEPDIVVHVDPRLMQQAFVHLVRNSIDTMPDGGILRIEVKPEEQRVRVGFQDTGHARDCQQRTLAADPLYTTRMIGEGMGLALVRRIVEEHGGRLLLYDACVSVYWAVVVLPRNGN